MKKLLSACLCLLLCASFVPALAEEANYQYALLDDGTAEIVEYRGNDQTLEIPAVLDGYSVTSIGDSAFYDCYSLILTVGRGSDAEEYCIRENLPYVYAR